MDEAGRFGVGGLAARVHAPRLKIAADRAGGNLPKPPLPRQPDLDVKSLARGEAHVARAERDGAIVQAEALQDLLGASRHALVLVARLFGRRDRDEFDLFELVLADHAARVLAGRARFRPEAERAGGEA